MSNNQLLCIRETVNHAKTLPFGDGVAFLGGFLLLTEGKPGLQPIKKLHQDMMDCYEQANLIETGQLSLDLTKGDSN